MCSCTGEKAGTWLFPLAALLVGFDTKGPRPTQVPTKIVDFCSVGQHTAHPVGGETRLNFRYFLEALLTICRIARKKLLWGQV